MDIILAISSFILGGMLGVLITAMVAVGGRADEKMESEDNNVIPDSIDTDNNSV